MGCCCCKGEGDDTNTYRRQSPTEYENTMETATAISPNMTSQFYLRLSKCPDPTIVDRLVIDTLGLIATLVDSEQDTPPAMVLLHNIADHEEGFLQVVKSMIAVVPLTDPLGPSIIALLLDDCPLPSKESVYRVVDTLALSRDTAINGRHDPSRQRNICVVLGCIAETLAGPRNLDILDDSILDYLLTNLEPTETDPSVMLFALIALEKFAQSSQNKSIVMKRFKRHSSDANRLRSLEAWCDERHYVKRQVGFCARWILDNLFIMTDRTYSYLNVNMDKVNAMLNTCDVSEYLKISPDGLEARCDAYSFESVRCTAQADTGIWYYEVVIVTCGVMQIGWATKNSNFLNHEGYGIGDDGFSLSYDGCRKLIWYNAKSEPQQVVPWCAGDVLGCLLDLETYQIVFTVNGVALPPCNHIFSMAKCGFFAAASFMSFQQCRFNFGAEPFHYPPPMEFSTFNGCNQLSAQEKIVLPRHILLERLREQNIGEDSCTICYDKKASVRLLPCEHADFCWDCASQLLECPMCRGTIETVIEATAPTTKPS